MNPYRILLSATMAVMVVAGPVLARAESEGGDSRSAAYLPAYQQECSACHVPYPPARLPAASWQRIMQGLGKHFGVDASLDASTTQRIEEWLQQRAGMAHRLQDAPPQDRITRSRWFLSQHDEISASTWKRASVGSPANCAACHPRAAEGKFSEHEVRIPK